MDEIVTMVNTMGFPIAVALILLWDRIKSNGSLKKVVENNNTLLKKIERKLI